MRILFVLLILLAQRAVFGQNQILSFSDDDHVIDTEPVREIFDEGTNGIYVNWTFPGAVVTSKVEQNQIFQNLYIKHFSHTQQPGLPSLPTHIDLVMIPEGASPSLLVIDAPVMTYNNFMIYPALEPASDQYGAAEPDFIIDSVFYQSNAVYPNAPVKILEIVKVKGVSLAMVQVFPVQYIPGTRKLMVHSKINYKINFSHNNQFLNKARLSRHFLKILPNLVINNESVSQEINHYLALNTTASTAPDYLIITHQDYLAAADSLARWKSQLGFHPEIISSASWTSSQVKAAIASRYQSYSPKPDYFVIIGDHDKVPGKIITSSSATFATDLYYATMDGTADYVPDMAYGRISVANAAQALSVVQKIINYERNPVTDSSFYQNGLNCAYFQDHGNGYAERRFAQTSEEIHDYVSARGYNVDRVYVTASNANPLHWNNGLYSAGESLPSYLKKPGFPWNGTGTQITNYINQGRFYVFHRDHGMSSGWGDPYYTTSNLNALNNGNKLPVVFSINCLTGKYMDAECFAEKFLRINNGGAVGVFAHGEVSYSGYNDGLALGLVDAIWASPGLVPNFTGTGGVSNPTLTPHTALYRMGDVKNQGLIRMIETWGGNPSSIQYTHELFNYFGDPAMEIKTATPVPVVASSADTLNCHTDSFLVVNTAYAGYATLVADGELMAGKNIQNGMDTLFFPLLSGTTAVLTISGHNRIPYIKNIVIEGGCPRPKFTATADKFCLNDSVLVTDMSTGLIASRSWNFGAAATPATATGTGPFYVHYATGGPKTITLTITDTAGASSSWSYDFNMDTYCRYNIPASGSYTINKCSGYLYDDGGPGNYSDNTLGSVTISPPGASSVTLNFSSFNFESGYDFLKIYDGPSVNSTLIGSYTGLTLPNNGQITSSAGSITIQQSSDSYQNESGFELSWQCNYPNTAPACNFYTTDTNSCNGMVSFRDNSLNGPSQWLWDFGDGITSTQQHPQHIYALNGNYTVKLTVSNAFGTDSLTKTGYVVVNRPNTPVTTGDIRCKTGSLTLSANYSGPGTVYWYDSLNAVHQADTGNIFHTPVIQATKTFFAEVHENKASVYTGKTDNSGGGGYFTANYTHYLVFDCYKPVLLHSVKVYAQSAGYRTIRLRNSGGSLLMQKQVYIPAGQHRITLNFELPVGINLQLSGPPAPGLYRNNGGISYPYRIDNVISIKHSSASSAPLNYYYYFYDWEIIEGSCVSQRVPVIATVSDTLNPVASFSYVNNDPDVEFTNTGNYADSYYWDFGDGDFSILENPVHSYPANGTFTVTFTATNACGQKSFSQQLTITTAGLTTNRDIRNFRYYPNPTRRHLFIDFTTASSQLMTVEILDVSGRTVLRRQYSVKPENHWSLPVGHLSSGLYSLILTSDKGRIIRKFVVE